MEAAFFIIIFIGIIIGAFISSKKLLVKHPDALSYRWGYFIAYFFGIFIPMLSFSLNMVLGSQFILLYSVFCIIAGAFLHMRYRWPWYFFSAFMISIHYSYFIELSNPNTSETGLSTLLFSLTIHVLTIFYVWFRWHELKPLSDFSSNENTEL